MVRDPWIIAAALFAFGVIGWVVVAERPQRARFGSRQPEPWLPTLTFDWSRSAAHTCGRNGDRAARLGSSSTDAKATKDHRQTRAPAPR